MPSPNVLLSSTATTIQSWFFREQASYHLRYQQASKNELFRVFLPTLLTALTFREQWLCFRLLITLREALI